MSVRRSPAVGLTDLASTGTVEVTKTTPSTDAYGLVVRLVQGVGTVAVGSTAMRVTNTTGQRVPVIQPSSFKPSTGVRVTNSSTQRVPVILPATQAIVVGEVEVKNDAGNPVPVSGTMSLSTGTLAALETIQVGNFPATQPVSGPLTDAQLRAAAVPVSGTVTANLGTIDGAATEATLGTISSSVDGLEALTRDVKRGVTDYETRLDYSTRLDGNPVYVGKHANGTSTTSTTWTVQKLTYDSLSRLIRAQVLTGSWSGRTGLGW